MIYVEINTACKLRDYFISMNRDQYSYEAYEAMLELFEDSEDNFELDVIALCCDFNEDTQEDFISNYELEINEDEDQLEVIENYLNNNAGYYRILNNKIFYQVF